MKRTGGLIKSLKKQMKQVSSLSCSHYVEIYCLKDTYFLLLVMLLRPRQSLLLASLHSMCMFPSFQVAFVLVLIKPLPSK